MYKNEMENVNLENEEVNQEESTAVVPCEDDSPATNDLKGSTVGTVVVVGLAAAGAVALGRMAWKGAKKVFGKLKTMHEAHEEKVVEEKAAKIAERKKKAEKPIDVPEDEIKDADQSDE